MSRLSLWTAAAVASAAVASGPSNPPIAERAARAQKVVIADIGEQHTEVPDGNVHRMMTHTRIAVREYLKGSGPSEVTVLQAGGKYGLWEAHATGDATLMRGQRAVLFLLCPVAERQDRCTLFGLADGVLEILADAPTQAPSGQKRSSSVASTVQVGEQRRPLAEVVREVRAAAGARP